MANAGRQWYTMEHNQREHHRTREHNGIERKTREHNGIERSYLDTPPSRNQERIVADAHVMFAVQMQRPIPSRRNKCASERSSSTHADVTRKYTKGKSYAADLQRDIPHGHAAILVQHRRQALQNHVLITIAIG